MKKIAIFSGRFTKKGNFTGYNASGKRIHISGETLKMLGYTPDTKPEEIKFPFFVLVDEREFNTRDENGNITTNTFKREQAGSCFKSEDELLVAANYDKMLELKGAAQLAAAATAAGLPAESIKQFLELA